MDSPINFYKLSLVSIVPKEAVYFHGKDFGKNPVGSGPLVANPAYHGVAPKRLYQESKNMPDGKARYEIFARMNQFLKDDLAFAMPVFQTSVFIGRIPFDHMEWQ